MPAEDTHNGIIKIDRRVGIKAVFQIEINKNTGAHHTYRINQDVFLPGINHTGDSRDDGNKFNPGGLLNVRKELLGDLLQWEMSWGN